MTGPVKDVQRGEQGRGAVPPVILRLHGGLPRLHRHAFPRPPERLDLRLLVDRQHRHLVRRIHVQPRGGLKNLQRNLVERTSQWWRISIR